MEKKLISVMLKVDQIEALKALSEATRVKMADYIREAVDLVIAKYQKELHKSKKGRR